MEQRFCRPTGWGFGLPAVLLLDGGMEKPSTISGFRMLCFWLFLVLYLSQGVSSFSAGSLGQELMRSAALSPLPSWICLIFSIR
jgi:hypothetical protein